MVDFVIMKANRPIATPNFHFVVTVRLAVNSKKAFFLAENYHQKLNFFVVDFLDNVDLQIESLHLQQFSKPHLGN